MSIRANGFLSSNRDLQRNLASSSKIFLLLSAGRSLGRGTATAHPSVLPGSPGDWRPVTGDSLEAALKLLLEAIMTTKIRILIVGLSLAGASLVPLQAQTAAPGNPGSRPEILMTSGYASFIDEELIDHWLIGGSARVYLTPRFGLEPEFRYMRQSSSDQDYVLQLNLLYDLRRPGSTVVPYLAGGLGLLTNRQKFAYISEVFTNTELTSSGGFGVKFFLNDRVFIAPEFRLGWEPVIQVTGSVGLILK